MRTVPSVAAAAPHPEPLTNEKNRQGHTRTLPDKRESRAARARLLHEQGRPLRAIAAEAETARTQVLNHHRAFCTAAFASASLPNPPSAAPLRLGTQGLLAFAYVTVWSPSVYRGRPVSRCLVRTHAAAAGTSGTGAFVTCAGTSVSGADVAASSTCFAASAKSAASVINAAARAARRAFAVGFLAAAATAGTQTGPFAFARIADTRCDLAHQIPVTKAAGQVCPRIGEVRPSDNLCNMCNRPLRKR